MRNDDSRGGTNHITYILAGVEGVCAMMAWLRQTLIYFIISDI
jgi:hypothetical protein